MARRPEAAREGLGRDGDARQVREVRLAEDGDRQRTAAAHAGRPLADVEGRHLRREPSPSDPLQPDLLHHRRHGAGRRVSEQALRAGSGRRTIGRRPGRGPARSCGTRSRTGSARCHCSRDGDLQDHDPTARPNHARHLAQAGGVVGQVPQPEADRRRIEAAVLEGQGQRVGLAVHGRRPAGPAATSGSGGACRRAPEHAARDVDADRLGRRASRRAPAPRSGVPSRRRRPAPGPPPRHGRPPPRRAASGRPARRSSPCSLRRRSGAIRSNMVRIPSGGAALPRGRAGGITRPRSREGVAGGRYWIRTSDLTDVNRAL